MNKVKFIHRLLILYTVALVALVGSTFLSFANLQPTQARANGLGCSMWSTDGINWNITCDGEHQNVQVIAVKCASNTSSMLRNACVPPEGNIYWKSEVMNSNTFAGGRTIRIGDLEPCGRVQVDVMVGGFNNFETEVAGGEVFPFNNNCGGGGGGGGGEPSYFACNPTSFRCERRTGTNPNQDGCSFEGQACDTRVPNFTISKVVVDEAGSVVASNNNVVPEYRVGDTIRYRVIVTNTGERPLTEIRFVDRFLNNFMTFQGGTVTRNANTVDIITSGAGQNARFNNNGYLVITDLNALTGNERLPVGASYTLNLQFRAERITTDQPASNSGDPLSDFFGTQGRMRNIVTADPAQMDFKYALVNVRIAGESIPAQVTIEKNVTGSQTNFTVGEDVPFDVTIRNTGSTTIDVLSFRDVFDPNYLELQSGTITFGTTTVALPMSYVNNITGVINIPDLTTIAPVNRNIAPNEFVRFNFIFEALADTQGTPTVNTAFTRADSLAEIRDDAQVTITAEEVNEPSIIIDKRFAPGFTNNFEIGDDVQFLINISNNGNTTLTQVRFQDFFDPEFLQYRSGSATFNGQTINFVDMNNFTLNSTTGQLNIQDLTTVFNRDLAPGETIVLNITFEALASTLEEPNDLTINTARATADNGLTDEDDQFVIIVPVNEGTRLVDIDKFIVNDVNSTRSYLVGEELIFQIRIENIGSLPLQVIQFSDDFDPAYLQIDLADSYITKNSVNTNRFSNLTGVSSYNPTTGLMQIADVTSTAIGLGDLAAGEYFDIFLYFTALQPTNTLPNGRTVNEAMVNADGITDEDDATVIIIPDTDIQYAACNQTCGGNILCQTGLVCDLRVNRCRLPANPDSLTCQPNNESGIDVEKVLTNDDLGDGIYRVGDEIIFQVRVENTSVSQIFNVISFTDTYDPAFLSLNLERSYIAKNNNLSAAYRDLRIPQVQNNTAIALITINDISAIGNLGDLAPGEFYDLYFSFTALAATTNQQGGVTINQAQASANGNQDQDSAVVRIDPVTTIIVTPVCNALCGGNVYCDATLGLACVPIAGTGENRCRLATNISSMTCQNTSNGGNLSIIKQATPDEDGDRTYSVADIVTYTIRITNTGNEALTSIRFSDRFEAQLISFQNGSISKYDINGQLVNTISNLSNLININSTGYMEITNIASSALGGLQPGEYYVITTNFLTRAPGVTRNIVITSGTTSTGNQTGDRQAEEVITIQNISTDI